MPLGWLDGYAASRAGETIQVDGDKSDLALNALARALRVLRDSMSGGHSA